MEFLHKKFQFVTQFHGQQCNLFKKTGNVTETKNKLVVHQKFLVKTNRRLTAGGHHSIMAAIDSKPNFFIDYQKNSQKIRLQVL